MRLASTYMKSMDVLIAKKENTVPKDLAPVLLVLKERLWMLGQEPD